MEKNFDYTQPFGFQTEQQQRMEDERPHSVFRIGESHVINLVREGRLDPRKVLDNANDEAFTVELQQHRKEWEEKFGPLKDRDLENYELNKKREAELKEKEEKEKNAKCLKVREGEEIFVWDGLHRKINLLTERGDTKKWMDWYKNLIHYWTSFKTQSAELKESIPVDYGENVFVLKDDGKILVSSREREYTCGKQENKKIVILNITSYIGTSWDAEHYYGHLKPHYSSNIQWKELREDKDEWSHVWGPEFCDHFEIEVTRPITRLEATGNKNPYNKWFNYEEGDPTGRFDTVQELLIETEKVFKQFFEPAGWTLQIEHDY